MPGRVADYTEDLDRPRPGQLHLRWGIRRDMPEILEIEAGSYDPEDRWDEDTFLTCLRRRTCIPQVAEFRGRVVGYVIYELHKDHLEILNLAAAPDARRCGVGAALIRKLVGRLSEHRRTRLTVTVAGANVAAQLFFRACGFRAVRVLRDEDVGERSAYQLEFRL